MVGKQNSEGGQWGGNPGVMGAGSVWDWGEERAVGGIPKGVEAERNGNTGNILHTMEEGVNQEYRVCEAEVQMCICSKHS